LDFVSWIRSMVGFSWWIFLWSIMCFLRPLMLLTIQEITFIGNMKSVKEKIQWAKHISLTPLT
jgi:hypothetical protein